MALINCPECKTDVSEQAFKCAKCGFKLRNPKRGFFGKLVKYSFIGWNVLMAISFFNGMSAASKVSGGAQSAAEQAGAAIGTGIGATMILALWAFGSVVLGLFVLFTRPKE